MERATTPTKATPEYSQGYLDGCREGYSKALLLIDEVLIKYRNPQIIVTTEENLERIKKEYIK